MLIGRESECARLEELLDRARLGRTAALVLRGEAGIGKTALLDFAAEHARGMTVVRSVGVESEAQIEFAALLEVCWPLRDHLDELPAHQQEVLRATLGFAPPDEQDQFSVGAATLSLLAAAAEANPVCVIVDDAQWLDRSSDEALRFALKRLQADRVALLFAARDGAERRFDAPGVETLELSGLGRDDAAALLDAGAGAVTVGVADRLWEATDGNPLALIELPGLLSPEQLAGSAPIDEPMPAGSSVERAFAGRADALPASARRALLVAAVSTSAEFEVIAAGLSELGLSAEDLEPAEDAGLVSLEGSRLAFRHPLVRSAVYHAAIPSDRRAGHRAIADGLVGSAHEEARALHLAEATLGQDEEAAAALESAAEHSRRRGGYSAAALTLERAARLTPEPLAARRRLCAAAAAAWRAGHGEAASELVSEALVGVDGQLRAECLRLRGAIDYFGGDGNAAAAAFGEAFELLVGVDAEAAVATGADLVNARVRARQPQLAVETAERVRRLAIEDGGDADLEATIAMGYALCFAGRYGDAEPHLRRAVELHRGSGALSGPLQVGRLSAALGWLGLHEQAHAYLAETVARARAAGAVGALPHLLASASWQALHATRLNEAYADASEALRLAEELDQPVTAAQTLGVVTWLHALRGEVERCRSVGAEAKRSADALGFRLYGLLVSLCFGLLELGSGHVDRAIAEMAPVAKHAEERGLYIPGVSPQLELAEAHVRSGQPGPVTALLESFDESELSTVPLFRAHAERCRGLIADAPDFDGHFEAALELHANAESPFALARTRLCFGEQLRRAGRRVEAREQLRAALEAFEAVGAEPWAERAAGELRASGETLRRRERHEAEELTPQELQIALQVAEGKSNKEVGAALFLSHKTIEFHLSRIYRKLDIHSRSELIRLYVAGAAPSTSPRESP